MIEQSRDWTAARPKAASAQAQVRDRFAAYVAIDWSGAKGRRHKGIAIAEARGEAAPRLVPPATSGRARRCSAGC